MMNKFGTSFADKSLKAAISFLEDIFLSEETANKKGLLQSLDPRAKIVFLSIMLVALLLTKDQAVFCVYFILSLILAFLSKIPIAKFLSRVWLFIPFFSLLIILPSTLEVFTPGKVILEYIISGINLSVTREGVMQAFNFVMRVGLSVSFVVLVNMTTRHDILLKGLSFFRVPDIYLATVNMCYRYLYVFVKTVENTYLSVKSRVGFVRDARAGRDIAGWNIAALWSRSYKMSNDIYNAMLSRGYDGSMNIRYQFKLKPADIVFVCGVAALILCCAVFVKFGVL